MGRPKKAAKLPEAPAVHDRPVLETEITEQGVVNVRHVPGYVNSVSPKELHAKIARLKAKINKETSKGCRPLMVSASEVDNAYDLRRPCGITQLDIATGGGIPAGGLAQITGANGVGKTALMWKYFAMHQKIYGEASSLLYVPVEFLPDWRHIRQRYGIRMSLPPAMVDRTDADRVARGLPPMTKAERNDLLYGGIGEFHVLRADTSEKLLDATIEAIDSNAFGIIAIDSISIMIPHAEAKLDTLEDEPVQAANAKLLTRFMQRFHPTTLGVKSDVLTTTIAIAQVRANRKKSEMVSYMARWEKDETAVGGANAVKHGKLVDITLWPGSKVKDPANKENILGKEVKWEITKGKGGSRDNLFGTYTYWYDDAKADDIGTIVEVGVRHGVCLEAGGNLTFINKDTGEPLQTPYGTLCGIDGIEQLRQICRDSIDTEIIIRREILAAASPKNTVCLYR